MSDPCSTDALVADTCQSLRDLRVSVPQAIRRGETAVLLCDFDLEGDSLYTVKWYKGRREFYRFTPKDEFPIKTFPIERIPIERHVDVSVPILFDRPSVGGFHCRTERAGEKSN
ncbi:UNVERIFIED_CONTAM: hypothetical protein PYX00_009820 [Menopon gallinae]|uniref:Ig-like domain-containing protein n=1 Tax=Menopon gallinae TaxID=328185 RepID=A0AAW2HDJ4_9NEOP